MIRKAHDSIAFFSILIFLIIVPAFSYAGVLTADTVWKGEIALTEDVLVPAGVTLTIAPGAVIRVSGAESSRTEPEFLSPLVEITVRGNLKAEGGAGDPITFISAGERKPGAWAGLLVDGGSASMRACRIESADTAVHLLDGTLSLHDSTFSGNRYGVVIQRKTAALRGAGNRLTQNDYGLAAYGEGAPDASFAGITGNRKKDMLVIPRRDYRPAGEASPAGGEPSLSRSYGDAVLKGETVWAQRVEVNGVVRVPEGSRLVILPGTVVQFGFKDTNRDGVGENGLLIQGVIVAKGRGDAPIIFRASGKGRRGAWDAVNIMNSGGAWNIFEHCRMEDAYRGLHFHFSRVAVTASIFTNCYRGVQFQESSVLMRENRFFANGSAVQGRDSQVAFNDNLVYGNFQGVNFLRVKLEARRNRIAANDKEGVRIREGATVAEENLIDGNRYGLQVMDACFGSFTRNCLTNNGETGFSLKNADNMEIAGNFIAGNGLNGLNLQDTRGRISGNLVSDNGERGVGILSFSGIMEENNFSANGLYAVDLEGSGDVAAHRNWWGGDEPGKVIHDKEDGVAAGRVEYGEVSSSPFSFSWPLAVIETGTVWRGDVVVNGTVTVAAGGTLTLAPASRALFSEQAGLAVYGRIIAKGERNGRIFFTSTMGKAASWNEVLLEHADGSSFENCVFEYATWGLHSHFTRLSVRESLFRHNVGGIRFRSGPVDIGDSVFTDNEIGIRDYRGNAVIAGNTITGNGTGIFVREKGGGITVRGNDLFANRDYNVRVGDFNDEDVDARENWWGGDDPGPTILDGRQEPGIGMVRFEPFLKKPARPGPAESK